MTTTRVIPLFLAVIGLAGCGTGGNSQSKTTYSYVDADQAKAAAQGQPMEDTSKIAQKNVTKAELAKIQRTVDADKSAYKAKAGDATKKKLVDDTLNLASSTMACGDLSPHEKYSTALRLYRQVLTIDPTNQEAIDWENQIIAIYKQMGRPVPN